MAGLVWVGEGSCFAFASSGTWVGGGEPAPDALPAVGPSGFDTLPWGGVWADAIADVSKRTMGMAPIRKEIILSSKCSDNLTGSINYKRHFLGNG